MSSTVLIKQMMAYDGIIPLNHYNYHRLPGVILIAILFDDYYHYDYHYYYYYYHYYYATFFYSTLPPFSR